jgi:hypothetical protein
VDFDRSLRDEERLCDLAVRGARGRQFGDAPLARREGVDAAEGNPPRTRPGGEQLPFGALGE